MAAPALPPGFEMDAHPSALPPGFALDAPKPARAPKPLSYGATDQAASSMTFGLADKAAALGGALGYSLRNAVTGNGNSSVSDNYSTELARTTEAKRRYEAANPNASTLLGALGLVAGGPAKTALSAVRAGVVAGTAGGALGAAGTSSGSYGEQAGQIALGAGIGAAAGGIIAKALPTSINAIGNAARPYVDRLRGVAGRAPLPPQVVQQPSRARQLISEAIAADGNTPQSVGRDIAAARQRGVPLGIADTGDNVRGLASSVSRAPGASRTIMRDAVIARQEGQTERVQGAIARDLGPTVGVATEAQRLEASAKARAAPLYEKAYAAGPVAHPTLSALAEHPDMQAALETGRAIHANETLIAKAQRLEPPPALPAPGDGLDVRSLDYAKRALDRRIDAAYSGDAQAKMHLPELKSLRGALLTSLDQAVPDYAAARAAYAGPMQSAEALTLGKGALNRTGDDIRAETAAMGPAELDQYKLGLRSAMSDAADNVVDGADKMKLLVGKPKKRAALEELFGGGKGLRNFMATLADEGKTSATYGRVNTGSMTSANQADDVYTGVQSALSIAGKAALRTGYTSPLHNIISTIKDVRDYGAGKAGEKVRAQLAAALSETDPAVLAEALRQARRSTLVAAAQTRAQAPARAMGSSYVGRLTGSAAGNLGGGQ